MVGQCTTIKSTQLSMTTIIGIQGDNFSIIVHDSRVSAIDDSGSSSQSFTASKASTKVSQNGRYLLGAAGDYRAINILHHAFSPPVPLPKLIGPKLDSFMTSKFIPALRECFDKHGYSQSPKEGTQSNALQGSSIIVSVNSCIYSIDGDYSWASDESNIYCLGTGSDYAYGALRALSTKKIENIQQAKKMALKAIGISSHFDPYTGSPFICHVQEQL